MDIEERLASIEKRLVALETKTQPLNVYGPASSDPYAVDHESHRIMATLMDKKHDR